MSGEIVRSEIRNWQTSLRAAVFDAVKESDVVEIMRSIVEKAKGGDLKAADFLFRYTLGTPAVKVQQHVTVEKGPPEQVIDVTDRREGDPSEEEILAAAERIRLSRDERPTRRQRA